jgi:hypothetical protein
MGTKLTWDDLFIPAEQVDFARIFAAWPEITGKVLPVGLSACGDAFFVRPDDSVWVLDTFSGEIRRVAASQSEFAECMNSQPWQEENLRSKMVWELRERGLSRGPAQVFAPVPHPIHVGSVRLDRAQVLDAIVWHSISSQALAQPGPVSEYRMDSRPWWKLW